MCEKPAPDAVLEFVSCCCKKNGCKTGACNCVSLELVCTDACGCTSCENSSSEDTETDEETEEDYAFDSDSSDDDLE